jgi:hypothetical protein
VRNGMGTETISATYRRTQTHESQSFSTELRNPKNLTNNLPFRYNSKGNEREE